jgi:nitroreductase
MNETLKTIYERRAVRKYKSTPVSRELIEQILDAGRMAPSAINRQPWKFYILSKEKDIQEFSKAISGVAAKVMLKKGLKTIIKTAKDGFHLAHGFDFFNRKDPVFHSAPVVIFITSAKDNEWAQLDIGMCAQNMMLAAKSLGLDTCPFGFGKFIEETKLYSKLNVPESEQVNLSIVFGYGDETPELHPRIKNNIFYL